MKKIITLMIACLLVLSGCGSSSSSSGLINNALSASDLSLKDFEIETKKIRDSGYELYASTLKNNSDYSILAFQIDFGPKSDVSESQLSVYSDFMKEHEDYIDDDSVTGVTLAGKIEQLVGKGDSTNKVSLTIGYNDWYWYDVPNEEQYNLMEPKEIQLGVIGKDNILYVAYYDYDSKEWTLDEQSKELNTWPDTELSKKIDKPECEYYNVLSDMESEDDLQFTAYGVSKDYYKEYVENIKSAGFTVDPYESESYYDADNQDDLYISVNYEEETEIMNVNIY